MKRRGDEERSTKKSVEDARAQDDADAVYLDNLIIQARRTIDEHQRAIPPLEEALVVFCRQWRRGLRGDAQATDQARYDHIHFEARYRQTEHHIAGHQAAIESLETVIGVYARQARRLRGNAR